MFFYLKKTLNLRHVKVNALKGIFLQRNVQNKEGKWAHKCNNKCATCYSPYEFWISFLLQNQS